MLLRFKVRLARLPLTHLLHGGPIANKSEFVAGEGSSVRVQSVRCPAWLHAHLPSTQILALSTLLVLSALTEKTPREPSRESEAEGFLS